MHQDTCHEQYAWYENLSTKFEAGDAIRDLQFDRQDLVQVLQAARYLSGAAAAFEDGDWNGDCVFNQLDVVAALQTGNYLQGAYVAITRGGVRYDEQTSMNAHTVAFLDQSLKGDNTFAHVLSTHDEVPPRDVRLSVTVETESNSEGLSVLLTDPHGQSFGVDPTTGESVDDFGQGSIGNFARIRPKMSLELRHDALASGDYTLTAVGSGITLDRQHFVQLHTETVRDDDAVFSRSTISS